MATSAVAETMKAWGLAQRPQGAVAVDEADGAERPAGEVADQGREYKAAIGEAANSAALHPETEQIIF
jgi:hypothetical protein